MAGREKTAADPPHSLEDHLYAEGLAAEHEHGPDADHDHDDFEAGPLEENPIFLQDNVWLTSVGIDIGSSGTQVIFSRIHLRRLGEELTSRYYVVSREPLFRSPVALTPYRSEELIDEPTLGRIIDAAYADAGVRPQDVDTGVVILTGEALRRENAEAIATILAERGGDFVCATAGHHMEATLAAYGSGAAAASHALGKRILNVDIGGGTTKFALVEAGKVTATAALHVGGRLQVVGPDGRIRRLDPAGKWHAAAAGFEWEVGDATAPSALAAVAAGMANAIIAAIRQELAAGAQSLWLTAPITGFENVAGIMISGGVGEFVYGRETRDFGDMGRLLGLALRQRMDAGALQWPLLPPGECIRATALGASEYSVQLSGSTIYVSDRRSLLPRRNLQVLQPSFACEDVIDPEALANAIRTHFLAFDMREGDADVALALRWQGLPSYARLSAFAAGIVGGLAASIAAGRPLYLVLDGDVAQVLGGILKEELGLANEVLVIDGLVLWDFDYVDIGRIRLPSHTVPVTVKSLVFAEDPRAPRRGETIHTGAGAWHHHEQGHQSSGHHHAHGHDHGHTHDHRHD